MPELWLPESVAPRARKVRKCLTCGATFPFAHLDRFARHIQSCEHGRSEEHVKQMESNVYTGFADPEAQVWKSKRRAEGKPATKRGRMA